MVTALLFDVLLPCPSSSITNSMAPKGKARVSPVAKAEAKAEADAIDRAVKRELDEKWRSTLERAAHGVSRQATPLEQAS